MAHQQPANTYNREEQNMKMWNVKIPVVRLEHAESAEAAIAKLRRRLNAAGFDVYDGEPADAFESEDDA